MTDILLQYGLQGIVAYGTVGLLDTILKRKGFVATFEMKLYALIGITFLVGFVPADLSNLLFNHLKEAIATGLAISALNTAVSKMGGK